MSQIPRSVLVTVVAALGGVAVFGAASGFVSAAGKHRGIDAQETPKVAATAGTQVIEAEPIDPSLPAPPEGLTPEEEEEAKKAEAAKKKEEEAKKKEEAKKAADKAKPPVEDEAEPRNSPVAPTAPRLVDPAPSSVEGPPPPTPEQTGPGLY